MRKDKRMLASDLDGTLIFKGRVSEENKKAVRRLKSNGMIFAVSTGRPYNEVNSVIRGMGVNPDYLILNNGALILNDRKEVIHREVLDHDVIRNITDDIRRDVLSIAIQTGFKTFVIAEKKRVLMIKLKTLARAILNRAKYEDSRVYISNFRNINNHQKYEFTMISLNMNTSTVEEVQEIADFINKKYEDSVEAFRNTVYIDIVPKGCSKGRGVQYASRMSGIGMEDVFTIGDSWNDESMFMITENSFTFTYAEESLKQKTSHIVNTVAQCIDEYMINDK